MENVFKEQNKQKFVKNWFKIRVERSREHQLQAYDLINNLVIKKRKGKEITLTDGRVLKDFITCSYLGLDMDERILKATTNNIYECGISFPAARTRACVKSFPDLEILLNKIFCNSFTTTLHSLHLIHLSTIPLLGSGELPSFPIKVNGARFIIDKGVHASIQINRSLMSQFGVVELIDFKDIEYLEYQFQLAFKFKQTPIAIADSLGSMGGLISVLELFRNAEKYDGYVYLDDAHGTSVHGQNGNGFVLKCLQNIFHPRLILTISLSKAFGAIGGLIALPTKEDIKFFKCYAPVYVFGGPPALPAVDAAIASAKIHLSKEIEVLQEKLWKNVHYFDWFIKEMNFEQHIANIGVMSPIRGVRIGNELVAIRCAKELQDLGIAVTTAMYPTVAKDQSLLRLALSAMHTKKDIEDVCCKIKEVFRWLNFNKTTISNEMYLPSRCTL